MAHTAVDEVQKGAFVRIESGFRHFIKKGGEFEPEKDRYHLYVSKACPWACRCLMIRALKGLEDVISVTVVQPVWKKSREDESDKHWGWPIGKHEDFPDCEDDPINGAKFVRDLYEKANDTVGKYSVPVLWDKKTSTIVNNESSEILRMLDAEFNDFAKNPHVSISPPELIPAIEEINEWVYPSINNGVYRCGFATTQEAYTTAIGVLVNGIDRAEKLLSEKRYLLGDRFTEADVRLFVTLVRFESVYCVHFKTFLASLQHRPNLTNYIREIYQIPGIAETVSELHIKNHYYRSHPTINPYAIVAATPASDFDAAHDRGRLAGQPIFP